MSRFRSFSLAVLLAALFASSGCALVLIGPRKTIICNHPCARCHCCEGLVHGDCPCYCHHGH